MWRPVLMVVKRRLVTKGKKVTWVEGTT